MMKEEWRDIEGYNGLYQVSNLIQLTIFNEPVAEYYSTSQASRQTGISHRNIAVCCRGERISAGGYKWKYKDG